MGMGVRDWLALTRIKLTAFVALSAAVGHVLAADCLSWHALWPAAGSMLLAAGGSVFNQIQEHRFDARMGRTRRRPLPARRLTHHAAVALATALLLVGLLCLAVFCGWTSTALGALAIAWYNLLYTPLKRRSAFIAVPGAMIGALGPAVGWTAAGGSVAARELWVVMGFFFLWQVPHFWLLNARHARDYRAAGFPTALERIGAGGFTRVIHVWTLATAISALALPLTGVVRHDASAWVLGMAVVALGGLSIGLLRTQAAADYNLRRGFAGINLFALVTMILLIVDRVECP